MGKKRSRNAHEPRGAKARAALTNNHKKRTIAPTNVANEIEYLGGIGQCIYGDGPEETREEAAQPPRKPVSR